MKKTLLLLFVSLLAIAVVVTGCGTTEDTNDLDATEASTDESAASGEVVDLVVRANNFDFDQEVYEIPLGATVNITIENDQGYHEAIIKGYDVEIKPGETVTFVADKEGEFEIFCSIFCGAGHDDMVSTVVVK